MKQKAGFMYFEQNDFSRAGSLLTEGEVDPREVRNTLTLYQTLHDASILSVAYVIVDVVDFVITLLNHKSLYLCM